MMHFASPRSKFFVLILLVVAYCLGSLTVIGQDQAAEKAKKEKEKEQEKPVKITEEIPVIG
jgi:hypothetical protein